MTERTSYLVAPLPHEGTALRTTETAAFGRARSGAVALHSPDRQRRLLTSASCRDYAPSAAEHSAVGFGDPVLGGQPPQAVFLRPLHGTPDFGRAVWETFGSAGLVRFANLHVPAPFVWRRRGGRSER